MEKELNLIAETGDQPQESLTDKLVWLLKGFIYPAWNRPYYKEAVTKPLGRTVVFLLIFALLQTLVSTAAVTVNLNRFGKEIAEAYQSGEIPTIQVQNGVATTSGSGKFQIENNRQILAVDTTGATKEIDTNLYSEGLLLTQNELHFLNEDGYQKIPLEEINQTFGNPIILNQTTVTTLWSRISLFAVLAVLFGGYLFYSVGRFLYLVVFGLVVWGAVSLSKKGVDFAPILITGIYANVPTTYLMFILRKVGTAFFGLRAIILLVVWGITIAYIIKDKPAETIPEQIPDNDL